MARTKKAIDRTRALELLEQIGNAAEVARRMGCHENSVRAISRANLKLCVRCNDPGVVPGKTLCAKCAEWDKDRMAAKRKERRRQGLCVNCGQPRALGLRIHCSACNEAANERNERYQKRRGPCTPKQKQDDLIERYGQDAWKRWQLAGGKCEACGAKYGEIAVHVHHIDEDRTNNTFDNFACLCFDCHRAVHRLISSRDRKALISWFEKTYPQHGLR